MGIFFTLLLLFVLLLALDYAYKRYRSVLASSLFSAMPLRFPTWAKRTW